MSLTIAAMPAYNEERSIAKMVLNCKKHVDCVVVVDDAAPTPGRRSSEALGGCKHIAPATRRRSRHASTGLELMAYGLPPQRH